LANQHSARIERFSVFSRLANEANTTAHERDRPAVRSVFADALFNCAEGWRS
jgi:hypothetical protein